MTLCLINTIHIPPCITNNDQWDPTYRTDHCSFVGKEREASLDRRPITQHHCESQMRREWGVLLGSSPCLRPNGFEGIADRPQNKGQVRPLPSHRVLRETPGARRSTSKMPRVNSGRRDRIGPDLSGFDHRWDCCLIFLRLDHGIKSEERLRAIYYTTVYITIIYI